MWQCRLCPAYCYAGHQRVRSSICNYMYLSLHFFLLHCFQSFPIIWFKVLYQIKQALNQFKTNRIKSQTEPTQLSWWFSFHSRNRGVHFFLRKTPTMQWQPFEERLVAVTLSVIDVYDIYTRREWSPDIDRLLISPTTHRFPINVFCFLLIADDIMWSVNFIGRPASVCLNFLFVG